MNRNKPTITYLSFKFSNKQIESPSQPPWLRYTGSLHHQVINNHDLDYAGKWFHVFQV